MTKKATGMMREISDKQEGNVERVNNRHPTEDTQK